MKDELSRPPGGGGTLDESPASESGETPHGEGNHDSGNGAGVSRRGFLRGLGGSLAATALTGVAAARGEEEKPLEEAAQGGGADTASGTASVTLTVNGQRKTAKVDPRRTLLDMLRNDFDLTGTKKVCDHGSCGACTVLVEGRPVYSCMTLALDCEGKKVETVEGLAKGNTYHPLQTAFVEKDGLMCGFCTPGFIMASKGLLDKNPKPTLEEVKTACSGNICRCGAYPNIFEAVIDASSKTGKKV